MIIAGLHSDRRRYPGFARGHHQQTGLELFVEEVIGLALIDQQIGQACAILYQSAGVIFAPCRLIMCFSNGGIPDT
mgnify:CR=1 FL=1